MSCSGMLTEARILPVLNSMIDGMPMPMPRVSGVIALSIATASCSTNASCDAWFVGVTTGSESSPPSKTETAILVPPTSTPITDRSRELLGRSRIQYDEQLSRAWTHECRGRVGIRCSSKRARDGVPPCPHR